MNKSISRNIALRVSTRTDQMMSFACAKPVAMKLLVIRMSRPKVMKKCSLHGTKQTYVCVSVLLGSSFEFI